MNNQMNSHILIVDDTDSNIDILVEALGDDYDLTVATNGTTAINMTNEELPDLILLDIMMPGMSGYDVCEILKNNPLTSNIPIIFLTAMTDVKSKAEAFRVGGVDYITKPFEILEIKARVNTHLVLKRAKDVLEYQNDILEERVKERIQEISITQDVTIEAIARLAEFRDPETGGHIKRTKEYVRLLAEQLSQHPKYSSEIGKEEIDLLYKSAPLHDIGKIGISDDILSKNSKLTDEEYELMKKHTVIGFNALNSATKKLGDNSFLRYAIEFARSHQEKWDGTGYPDKLSGEGIPLSGRIMAIADVYDALISRRPYKPPYPHKKAVEIIKNGSGSHFDPSIVEVFVDISENFQRIADVYQERQKR